MNWLVLFCLTITSTFLATVTLAKGHMANTNKISKFSLPLNFVSYTTKEQAALSPEQIKQKAQSITVKVLSGDVGVQELSLAKKTKFILF